MPTKRKHPNRVSLRPNGKFKRVCGKSSGKDAQFYLDTKDKAEAQRRSLCLHQFWDKKIQNGESDWGQDLEHARSIAQSGHIEIPFNESDSDTPKAHLKYLEEIAKQQSRFEHLQVRVVPSNTDIYELGREKAAKDVQEHIQKAKQLGVLADLPPSTYSNQTLHQALESFINWVKKEHRDRDFPERVSGNGEQIIKRSLMIKRATPDYPLEQFNLKAIDKIARYFKSRPQTTWNTQMAISSVENAIKTLRRFINWLSMNEDYDWKKPTDWEQVCKFNQRKLMTSHEISKRAHGIATLGLDQLKTIYHLATDYERSLLLMGLNFGFAQAEIGWLWQEDLYDDPTSPSGQKIRMVRHKTGIPGQFHIWPETWKALEWTAEYRSRYAPENYKLVFVNERGKQLDRQRIQRSWEILRDRVLAIHPDLKWESFKNLRKTSGQMIKDVSDGETMAVFHMRGQSVSTDDLADYYSNRCWEKVFAAQAKVYEQLQPMFAEAPDAFSKPRGKGGPNITRMKIKNIQELSKKGVKASVIAKLINVSTTTVYRWRSMVS